MDITYYEDHMVFQVIGGVIDLYILSGPKPTDVVRVVRLCHCATVLSFVFPAVIELCAWVGTDTRVCGSGRPPSDAAVLVPWLPQLQVWVRESAAWPQSLTYLATATHKQMGIPRPRLRTRCREKLLGCPDSTRYSVA